LTGPRYVTAPAHVRALDQRIQNLAHARSENGLRLRRTVANTILAQLLPSGVVKGGAAVKFRAGEARSRFTRDFDAAREAQQEVDEFIAELTSALAAGWGGFTGRVIRLMPAEPDGVPGPYVMQPFDVKMAYCGQSWLTVRFELGHDEIGSTAASVPVLAVDIVETFERLGLPEPAPIPVLAVEHQIAQKLHACTTPDATGNNERAHDLVDLQLLVDLDPPDLALLHQLGQRLFAARRMGAWPPVVRPWDGWPTLDEAAAESLDVLPFDDAIAWVNILVASAVATVETGGGSA
jgi:hypothetical protein